MSKFLVFAGAVLILISPHAFASGPSAPVAATGIIQLTTAGDDGDFQKGVPWPNPRFVDNGDGTITDKLTSLVWMQHASCWGRLRYVDARRKVEVLNRPGSSETCGGYTGGRSDWRIPNAREMLSLIDISATNRKPQGAEAGITGVTSSYYWTSTTRSGSVSGKWTVWFHSIAKNPGNVADASESQNNTSVNYVWLVSGTP